MSCQFPNLLNQINSVCMYVCMYVCNFREVQVWRVIIVLLLVRLELLWSYSWYSSIDWVERSIKYILLRICMYACMYVCMYDLTRRIMYSNWYRVFISHRTKWIMIIYFFLKHLSEPESQILEFDWLIIRTWLVQLVTIWSTGRIFYPLSKFHP